MSEEKAYMLNGKFSFHASLSPSFIYYDSNPVPVLLFSRIGRFCTSMAHDVLALIVNVVDCFV